MCVLGSKAVKIQGAPPRAVFLVAFASAVWTVKWRKTPFSSVSDRKMEFQYLGCLAALLWYTYGVVCAVLQLCKQIFLMSATLHYLSSPVSMFHCTSPTQSSRMCANTRQHTEKQVPLPRSSGAKGSYVKNANSCEFGDMWHIRFVNKLLFNKWICYLPEKTQ